jgi:hypothetical protein
MKSVFGVKSTYQRGFDPAYHLDCTIGLSRIQCYEWHSGNEAGEKRLVGLRAYHLRHLLAELDVSTSYSFLELMRSFQLPIVSFAH